MPYSYPSGEDLKYAHSKNMNRMELIKYLHEKPEITQTQRLEDRYSDYYGEDSLVAQQLMNQYNNESATKQQEFQQYMSDTAHQREVKDLIAAGLNPQLSANAGAPAMVGAYAGVDSSPTSAAATRRIQLELQKNELANQQLLNKQNLENALLINKYSVDKSFELGQYQAQVGAAATRDAASMAAAASMYNGSLSASAQRYAADLNYQNQQEQRTWDSFHPSNKYQAAGSALQFLYNTFSGNSANTVKNYGNNSTAK